MSRAARVAAALACAAVVLAACAPAHDQPPAGAEPTPASAGQVVLFVGDSYTLGTGLADADRGSRWSSVVARALEWDEANLGCDGSGYTRRGLLCGTTYAERITEYAGPVPAVVVLSGGFNDLGATQQQMADAVAQTVALARSEFPDATLVVMNAYSYDVDDRPERLDEFTQALREAARNEGAVFVDVGEPFAGRADLMSVDGVHPNVAGHALLAEITLAVLIEAGVVAVEVTAQPTGTPA